MKRLLVYIGCLSLFCMTVSCEKWLTIQPENEVEKTKLYETEEGFWQALNGTYYLIKDGHYPEGPMVSLEIEYLAGIWEAGSQTVQYRLSRHEYKHPDVDKFMGDLFLYQYNLIAHANTILHYVDQVDFLPEKSYNLIKGEAMALRAWVHFDLLRLWGPVPSNVDPQNRYLPYVKEVSKKVNVYDTYDSFMSSLRLDLDTAEMLLGKSEPLLNHSCEELNSNDVKNDDRLEMRWRQHRFNYYAVLGLKARVALWTGKKEEAFRYASMVRDAENPAGSPKFRLGLESDLDMSSNYQTNDNLLSKEHLFSMPVETYNPDQNLGSGNISTASSNMSYLFSDSDKNDFRYKLWWGLDKGKSTTYKYRCRTNLKVPLIRLAEMYLIMIEVAPLDEANRIYEEFCNSRGAVYVPMTEDSRNNVIIKEYYRELLAEGQIFFASKRLFMNKLMWQSGTMTEAQYVLPIPRRETEIFN